MKDMTPKNVAIRMMNRASCERVEAEKMFGIRFEDMTKEQRRLAATCISAFYPQFCKKYCVSFEQ